jgi:hypothetical protein
MVQLHAQTTIAIFSIVSIGAFAYWYYTRPKQQDNSDTETKKETKKK